MSVGSFWYTANFGDDGVEFKTYEMTYAENDFFILINVFDNKDKRGCFEKDIHDRFAVSKQAALRLLVKDIEAKCEEALKVYEEFKAKLDIAIETKV